MTGCRRCGKPRLPCPNCERDKIIREEAERLAVVNGCSVADAETLIKFVIDSPQAKGFFDELAQAWKAPPARGWLARFIDWWLGVPPPSSPYRAQRETRN